MESSQALLSEYARSNLCYTGFASGKRYRKLRLTIEIKEVSVYATYLNTKQVRKSTFFCLPNNFQKSTEYFNTHCKLFCISQTGMLRKTVYKRHFLNVDNSRFDFEHARCSVVSFTSVFTSSSRSLSFDRSIVFSKASFPVTVV